MRIEVRYGLEGVLTDATRSRIINETIAPLFKQGDFYGGINAGLDQMIRVIDGEPLPAPDQAWKSASDGGVSLAVLMVGGSWSSASCCGRFIGRAPAARASPAWSAAASPGGSPRAC